MTTEPQSSDLLKEINLVQQAKRELAAKIRVATMIAVEEFTQTTQNCVGIDSISIGVAVFKPIGDDHRLINNVTYVDVTTTGFDD